MAQDFGDAVGEMLFRAISTHIERAIERYLSEIRHSNSSQTEKSSNTEKDASIAPKGAGKAEAVANAETKPTEVCVPFGTKDDAAYFAQVAHESGVDVSALADTDGGGYIQFATDDLEKLRECTTEFAELMTEVKEREISQRLDISEPVSDAQFAQLTKITSLPNLDVSNDAREHETGVQVPDEATLGHTDRIREHVLVAREQCSDFKDFERLLAKQGIGVSATRTGEVMFYEARQAKDGQLLPFGKDERGKQDWAVGADRLRERWGVDATHDWFEKNTPKGGPGGPGEPEQAKAKEAQQAADGALDTDGRTPDLNQGVASHDSLDTDVRTVRIEREQNGTDVAPSIIREEEERVELAEERVERTEEQAERGDSYYYNSCPLKDFSREHEMASKANSEEHGIEEHDVDLSDKMDRVR